MKFIKKVSNKSPRLMSKICSKWTKNSLEQLYYNIIQNDK